MNSPSRERPETRVHRLKTWPEPFRAVLDGRKSYEIRVNDRGYMVGDILELAEWDPSRAHERLNMEHAGYTGREVRKRVTYMTPGGQWGLPANLCVLGVAPVPRCIAGSGYPVEIGRCRLDVDHDGPHVLACTHGGIGLPGCAVCDPSAKHPEPTP